MQVNSLYENQVMTQSNVKPDNSSEIGSSENFKNIFLERCRFVEPLEDAKNHLTADTGKNGNRVKLLTLGKISPKNPTISDLLIKHPDYGNKCWQIIHSEQNKGKSFNNVKSGTNIYMNPMTLEISWNNEHPKNKSSMSGHLSIKNNGNDIQPTTKGQNQDRKHMHLLGIVSHENTTVSSLIVKHPEYGERSWQIIHSPENNNKPFDKIKFGTAIYIDSKTHELSWKIDKNPVKQIVPPTPSSPYVPINDRKSPESYSISDKLEFAVRSYLGRSYADLDCYELVIRGLKQAGIQYSGKNGLKEKLVQKALNKGLPVNSYLTGEGIIKTAGYHVFTKTLQNISDPTGSANTLMKEMKPFLDRGLILSFSTPTRGHVGIISNNKKLWTFINSGTLDNQFEKQHISKGVGEELLSSEVRNWLHLAAKKKETLQITLGRVSQERLTAENLTPLKEFG